MLLFTKRISKGRSLFSRAPDQDVVSAMADQLAYENSEYIKRIASEKLAQIDEYVSNYVLSISRK